MINVLSRLSSDYKDYQQILDYQFHNINFRYRQGLNKTDMAMNSLEYENDFKFMSAEIKLANSIFPELHAGAPPVRFLADRRDPGTTVVMGNARPEELVSGINSSGCIADLPE